MDYLHVQADNPWYNYYINDRCLTVSGHVNGDLGRENHHMTPDFINKICYQFVPHSYVISVNPVNPSYQLPNNSKLKYLLVQLHGYRRICIPVLSMLSIDKIALVTCTKNVVKVAMSSESSKDELPTTGHMQ